MAMQQGQQALDDQRADVRHEIAGHPMMLTSQYFTEQIVVKNIARLGFLARSRVVYRTGDIVTLHLPHIGAASATIIWQNSGQFGARFHSPIDMALFGSLLQGLRFAEITDDQA